MWNPLEQTTTMSINHKKGAPHDTDGGKTTVIGSEIGKTHSHKRVLHSGCDNAKQYWDSKHRLA